MKTIKHVIISLVIAAAGTTSVAVAQQTAGAATDSSIVKVHDQESYFKTLEKSLLFGLSSDVTGVLESALFNAVNYKVVFPQFNSEEVQQKLTRLAMEGPSHSLRFKAYLTLNYYKNQDQFETPASMIGLLDHRDQNRVFYFLQDQVQEGGITVLN
jgi:hypothetical protein